MTTELSDQIFLARELRRAGLLFCHVPNGGRRDKGEAARLRASGVQPGVPDLLLFDPPPAGDYVGCALELKRAGRRRGKVSDVQQKWLDALALRGWAVVVAYGSDEALTALQGLGYEV